MNSQQIRQDIASLVLSGMADGSLAKLTPVKDDGHSWRFVEKPGVFVGKYHTSGTNPKHWRRAKKTKLKDGTVVRVFKLRAGYDPLLPGVHVFDVPPGIRVTLRPGEQTAQAEWLTGEQLTQILFYDTEPETTSASSLEEAAYEPPTTLIEL